MKRQVTDWEKTVAKHISDEGLTYIVYIKKFYKLMIAGIGKYWAGIAAAHNRLSQQVNWLQIDSHHKNKTDSRIMAIYNLQSPVSNQKWSDPQKNGQCD